MATARICDLFKVKTNSALFAPDVVSIAELAQYVETETDAEYPMARAYDRVREEFSFEIDEENHLYYVDFQGFRAEFKDGSSMVTINKRK